MKKSNGILLIVLLMSCALMGCGNTRNDSVHKATIYSMDTVMELTVYGEQGEAALTEARALIYQYENLLSATKKNSDVSKINNHVGEYVSVHPETYEVIHMAQEISNNSDGMFDISIAPLMKIWGFTNKKYRIPTKVERTKCIAHVDYKRIKLKSPNQVKIEKGMTIDLGGIAKGYTSQKLTERLKKMGVTSAVLSLGGNIETIGCKPDGTAFQIGIANPKQPEQSWRTIAVTEAAVVTSGTYERYFEINGTRYHHIMDTGTGEPVNNSLASVTIVTSNSTVADGLSTALFAMGYQKAIQYQKKHQNFEILLIQKDGTTYSSKKFPKEI